jgi:hypothetical protein
MARKTKPTPKAAAPQFDEAPLADDEEEGACPIPDDDGNIVLRRSKPATKGVKRGKGKDDKPAR